MNDLSGTSERPIAAARLESRGRSGNRRARLVLLLIGVVAVLLAISYWYVTKDQAGTDDAYTDGRAITIAPQVAGVVTTLAVTDNQHVRRGDLLLGIEPDSFKAARDEASGSLQVARAQLANATAALETARVTYPARLDAARAHLAAAQAAQFKAQADEHRQRTLPRQATTQQEIDSAEAALRSANADVAQAEAQAREADMVRAALTQAEAQVSQLEGQVALAKATLAQAELNLGWTRVTAPQEGWVTKRAVEAGNYVSAGQALLTLVTPEIWVTANFKEDQLDRMRPGQTVEMRVDAYPALRLIGHVDSVQLGSGQRFSTFPAENATGNFVKVVQRIPVKIVIDSGLPPDRPLPLGLSVVPTVRLQ
jgi:membrane fusion protein (multidrug efflux system)